MLKTEDIEKLPHQFGTEWKSDDENHWHECACGEKTDMAAHTSDEGKVTTPATETEKGVKTYSCTVCGKVLKTEAIPATGMNTTVSEPENPNDSNTPESNSSDVRTPDSNIPKAGDTPNLSIWIALMLLAAGGLTGSVFYARKRKAE